jgi:hypothetical protein
MANGTLRNFNAVRIGAEGADLTGTLNTDYVEFDLVPNQNIDMGDEGIRDTVDDGQTIQHGITSTITFYSFDLDILTATLSSTDYVNSGGTITAKAKIGFVGAGSTDDVVYDGVRLNAVKNKTQFERTAAEVFFTKTSDTQPGNDTLA